MFSFAPQGQGVGNPGEYLAKRVDCDAEVGIVFQRLAVSEENRPLKFR